jgi:hypothetical protein
MSWGTNYVTANNITLPYPGIIQDGRFFTDYSPNSVLNDSIKLQNGLVTNTKYKEYLTKNATRIMSYNFNTTGTIQNLGNTYPYTFSDVNDKTIPPGYETSLPKNMYLTREQLNANQTRPLLSHFEMN